MHIVIRPPSCPCCERWTKAVDAWQSYDAGPAAIFGFLPVMNRCNPQRELEVPNGSR